VIIEMLVSIESLDTTLDNYKALRLALGITKPDLLRALLGRASDGEKNVAMAIELVFSQEHEWKRHAVLAHPAVCTYFMNQLAPVARTQRNTEVLREFLQTQGDPSVDNHALLRSAITADCAALAKLIVDAPSSQGKLTTDLKVKLVRRFPWTWTKFKKLRHE
jgi:hypothetical protein